MLWNRRVQSDMGCLFTSSYDTKTCWAVWSKLPYVTTTVALEACWSATSIEETWDGQDQLDILLQTVLGGKQKPVPCGLHSKSHLHCDINTKNKKKAGVSLCFRDTQWSHCHHEARFLGHWLLLLLHLSLQLFNIFLFFGSAIEFRGGTLSSTVVTERHQNPPSPRIQLPCS